MRPLEQFFRFELCRLLAGLGAATGFVGGAVLAATIAQSRPGAPATQPVLCRTEIRHPRSVRAGRAIRAAGVRAGLMVRIVVGDGVALAPWRFHCCWHRSNTA
jgi:hypothetical protein